MHKDFAFLKKNNNKKKHHNNNNYNKLKPTQQLEEEECKKSVTFRKNPMNKTSEFLLLQVYALDWLWIHNNFELLFICILLSLIASYILHR